MKTINKPHLAPTLTEAFKMYRLRRCVMRMLSEYYRGIDLPMDFDHKRLEELVQRIDERFMDFDMCASPEDIEKFNTWVETEGSPV